MKREDTQSANGAEKNGILPEGRILREGICVRGVKGEEEMRTEAILSAMERKETEKKRARRKRKFWRAVGVIVKNVVYLAAGWAITCAVILVMEELIFCADSRLMLEIFISFALLCWFIDYMENNHFCVKRKK